MKPAIITESLAKKEPSFAERLKACSTAFLSIPKYLQSPENIGAVRNLFSSVRVRTFERFIKSKAEWRDRLAAYLGLCDALIIVTDASRVVTGGVFREVCEARTLKKLLVIYNVVTKRWEQYFGFEMVEREGRKVRLLRSQPESESVVDKLGACDAESEIGVSK